MSKPIRDSPWLWAAIFFGVCFFLYTRSNTHPAYYEKDAPSKVAQVLSGERNYFHPLLMLNATDAALRVTGQSRTEQNAVVAGRTVIAAFAALAVAAFVWLGHLRGGWRMALSVGVCVALNPQLLQFAHYFKEDPALLFGLALSFLAMQHFFERRTLASAAWLGSACALAVAGKYVGVAAPAMALILLGSTPVPNGRTRYLAAFSASFIGVLLVVDYQWVLDFGGLRTGFNTEIDSLTRPSKVGKIPHLAEVAGFFRKALPLWVAVFALVEAGSLWRRGWRRDPVGWLLVLYAFAFTGVLAFSPRLFDRHFLPVIICLHVLAGMGVVSVADWASRRWPRLANQQTAVFLVLLGLIAVYGSGPVKRIQRSLKQDHRKMLVAWIRLELPANAIIAQDRNVYLISPDGSVPPGHDMPQQVITKRQLSEFQSLAQLRALGVTHVALHKQFSGRFLKGAKKAAEQLGPREDFSPSDRAAREFYRDLQGHAQLVWDKNDGRDTAMNPGLQLYELPPGK